MSEEAPKFNGDEEIDYVLAGEDPRPELQRMVDVDRERTLWRLGRALARLAKQDEEMARYVRMVQEEALAERSRLRQRMADIEAIFEAEALAQRERDGINSLTVPGVGRWGTKRVPASWRTEDDEAAIAALDADERAFFTERVEVTELRKDAFKKWLDERELDEWPGMVRSESRVSVKSPFDA